MRSAIQTMILALALVGCIEPAKSGPDALGTGGTDGGTCGPRDPACSGELSFDHRELPVLPDGHVEGAFAGTDDSSLRIDADGTTVSIATAHAGPLAEWLPVGELVVASSDAETGVLRVERASDGALLLAIVRSDDQAAPPTVIEDIAGLGVSGTERAASCGYGLELGFECPPMPMVGQDLTLHADGAPDVVAPLGETITLETSEGRFEVTNLASSAMDTEILGSGSCSVCAPYIGAKTYLDIVRVD